jgi:hypothetical protein
MNGSLAFRSRAIAATVGAVMTVAVVDGCGGGGIMCSDEDEELSDFPEEACGSMGSSLAADHSECSVDFGSCDGVDYAVSCTNTGPGNMQCDCLRNGVLTGQACAQTSAFCFEIEDEDVDALGNRLRDCCGFGPKICTRRAD